jgi:hypothetical protein
VSDATPRAVWSGSFKVWGVEVHCSVLDDGRRIIEKDSFDRLVAAMKGGAPDQEDSPDLAAFTRWQAGETPS